MKKILKKIYQGYVLNEIESYTLFKLIISKQLNDVELSAILIALKIRGESKNEILGAVRAYLENSILFPKPKCIFADISGTGGDFSNSINISTTSALVGSVCGLKIIKHCNKNISSKTGSADILKEFGINIKLNPKESKKMFKLFNICFLYAPKYHTSFKFITPVRKILNTRTIFNIIGPLLNPSLPPLVVIGVYDKSLMLPIAEILKILNCNHAIIVYSNHIDEVTLHSVTNITELTNNNIISYTVTPNDFGVNYYSKNDILGGYPKTNFKIIKQILQGKGLNSITETIAVNVAMLLKVFGHSDLKKNTQFALETIRSGKVYDKIIEISKF